MNPMNFPAYFAYLQFMPKKKLHPKVKFTAEDDKKLKDLVEQYGTTDWNLISQKMETRNARQCRERWENYLSSNVNRSPFTPEEDLLLMQKYQELGAKWVAISKSFNNRTDISVKSRWMVLKRRNVTMESLQTAVLNRQKQQQDTAEMVAEHQERSDNVDKVINRLSEIAELDEADNWGYGFSNDSFWFSGQIDF